MDGARNGSYGRAAATGVTGIGNLVHRARHGDEEAFEELVDLTGDRCLSIAYRILRDLGRAEDAVQLAFIQAWRSLPSLADDERFEAWLTRILVNECYADMRRQRRRPTVALRPDDDQHPTERDPYISVEQREQLERAFAHLSLEQRAAFVLHHHAGLSLEDVADATHAPLGTVKSRIHYAGEALRAAIAVDDSMAQSRRIDP